MTKRQHEARASKMLMRNTELRNTLWPDIAEKSLWHRKRNQGFTTVPRPMPQILQIMDYLAGKGKPVSQAYLSLWCRVFDESFIEIKNERELAAEGGFSGERQVTTWHARMKLLSELGFIEVKPGTAGKYQYVLILNPYTVIKTLRKENRIPEHLYIALFSRAQEVGADNGLK